MDIHFRDGELILQDRTFYRLSSVKYCFPCQAGRYIDLDSPLLGVLSKYANKNMTREEADEFLCEVLRRRPYMKNSMVLEISVDEVEDGCAYSFYQTLTIRNDDTPDNIDRKFKETPIKWRK